ncbi:hypothetical protein [Moraxella lacunata]|uniref:hypothetical protein n=1 Tax=Moraxella lacunata TaxID=477 RepID=UPI003EE182ED
MPYDKSIAYIKLGMGLGMKSGVLCTFLNENFLNRHFMANTNIQHAQAKQKPPKLMSGF